MQRISSLAVTSLFVKAAVMAKRTYESSTLTRSGTLPTFNPDGRHQLLHEQPNIGHHVQCRVGLEFSRICPIFSCYKRPLENYTAHTTAPSFPLRVAVPTYNSNIPLAKLTGSTVIWSFPVANTFNLAVSS